MEHPAANTRRTQKASGSRRRSPYRRRARPQQVFAALDLGTNNCRLLIAQPVGPGFRVLDGYSRTVRLGEGVEATGRLSDVAMARALKALDICASKMDRWKVTHIRCVATEACRQAENADAFANEVARQTGLTLEIIDANEEAALTLAGCEPLLDPGKSHGLLFDVGGGSAELVWLRQQPEEPPKILGITSLPCGVVTLTERYGTTEFSVEEYARVMAEIEAMLLPFEQEHGISRFMRDGSAQMLGTAGTVTTISGVVMGLGRYDRSQVDGSILSFDAVRKVSGALVGASFDERAAYPCIGKGRADLVVAGCAVLEAVCRTWPAGEIRVADRGVREGILTRLAVAAGMPGRWAAGVQASQGPKAGAPKAGAP